MVQLLSLRNGRVEVPLSYPQHIDLRTVLEEIPDTWPHLVPQIGKLFEASQGVECAVCLQAKYKISLFSPLSDGKPRWASSIISEPEHTGKYSEQTS